MNDNVNCAYGLLEPVSANPANNPEINLFINELRRRFHGELLFLVMQAKSSFDSDYYYYGNGSMPMKSIWKELVFLSLSLFIRCMWNLIAFLQC